MAQRTGALVFDELTDRYDIRFDLSDYYGGLHCGDCLEVFVRGKWKPTRMEYGQNWYLVGIRAEDLNGLSVLSDCLTSKLHPGKRTGRNRAHFRLAVHPDADRGSGDTLPH